MQALADGRSRHAQIISFAKHISQAAFEQSIFCRQTSGAGRRYPGQPATTLQSAQVQEARCGIVAASCDLALFRLRRRGRRGGHVGGSSAAALFSFLPRHDTLGTLPPIANTHGC